MSLEYGFHLLVSLTFALFNIWRVYLSRCTWLCNVVLLKENSHLGTLFKDVVMRDVLGPASQVEISPCLHPYVYVNVSTLPEHLFWEGGGDKGEPCDRRQKVEEEQASKNRRFCGSWRQMRKKVILHLPLLQRAPAQKLDETKHLILNTGPTALLAQSECVSVCLESFSQSGVWTESRR